MTGMFQHCTNLITLDLSSFVINDNANDGNGVTMLAMFAETDALTNKPYIKFNEKYSSQHLLRSIDCAEEMD